MRIMLLIMEAIHRMCRNTLHMKTQRWSMISERIIIEWFGSEKTFKGHLSNPPAMNVHHQASLNTYPPCFFLFISNFLFLLLLLSSWLGQ